MKNNIDKFKHLDNMDPSVESILKMPLDAINDTHLDVLKQNLSRYSKHSNPEIADAANVVIGKIDSIISLSQNNREKRISGVIMEVSNLS